MLETILPPPPKESIRCERSGELEPWGGHLECPCERVYQTRDESAPGYAAGRCPCGRPTAGADAEAWRICTCGYASRLAELADCPPRLTEQEIAKRAAERRAEEAAVNAWNEAHAVGSRVLSSEYLEQQRETTTTSPAWLDRDGCAVVGLAATGRARYLGAVVSLDTVAAGEKNEAEGDRGTEPCDMSERVPGLAEGEP